MFARPYQHFRALLLTRTHNTRHDVYQLIIVLLERVLILAQLRAPAQVAFQKALLRYGCNAAGIENEEIVRRLRLGTIR